MAPNLLLYTPGCGFHIKSNFPFRPTLLQTRPLTPPEVVYTSPRLPQMRSPDVPKTGLSVPGRASRREAHCPWDTRHPPRMHFQPQPPPGQPRTPRLLSHHSMSHHSPPGPLTTGEYQTSWQRQRTGVRSYLPGAGRQGEAVGCGPHPALASEELPAPHLGAVHVPDATRTSSGGGALTPHRLP